MHHFAYRDGSLHAEGVDLKRIAAEVGTPVYVYSTATIERHYKLFAAAVKKTAGKTHVFYAMKANGNLGVLKTLGALGAGIVTVTGVRPQPDVIGNVACDCRTGEMHVSMRPAHPGVFYGTGDVFASALAALLVRGAPLSAALETATALTDESICRSLWRDTPRRFGVDFEGALPAYIRRVEKIFEA